MNRTEERKQDLYEQAMTGDIRAVEEYGAFVQFLHPEALTDTEQLMKLYKDAARKKSVRSMLYLGELYEFGLFTKENRTFARIYYSKAYGTAKDYYLKEIAAAHSAALLMQSTDEEDWDSAGEILSSVSGYDVKFAPTAYLIGDMCREGKGRRQRDHTAYESYLVAKDLIYKTPENRRFLGQILMRYGELYAFGIYVKQDPERAQQYFKEAEEILSAHAENRDGYAVRALERLKKDRKALSVGF